MKLCLVCVEIFAWGKYGGFGRSTRMIGREMVKRGVEVTAVVPRRAGQRPIEELDGIRVLGFEPYRPFSAIDLFREADADIYHSQEPSFGTYLAQRAMPKRKHVVTFRDTRDLKDWWIELKYPSLSHAQVLSNFVYEDNFLVHNAVRKADRVFAASEMLIPKARKRYKLNSNPEFLPSPIYFPNAIHKSETPLVSFIARMDRRKRPELFFNLARQFPDVQFEAIGTGRDLTWERELKSRYGTLPNLTLRDFINQFEVNGLSDLLDKSWILVNTSARESLPTTFVEAAAHGCAILSEIDPDGFASNFGWLVREGDYATGLKHLLREQSWKVLGERGMTYARENYNVSVSLAKHLNAYHELLG